MSIRLNTCDIARARFFNVNTQRLEEKKNHFGRAIKEGFIKIAALFCPSYRERYRVNKEATYMMPPGGPRDWTRLKNGTILVC
jgi:hypothetical protein